MHAVLLYIPGAFLLVAGASKLMALHGFESGLIDFGIGSARPRRVVSRIIPILEVVLGLVLLSGRWSGPAAVVAIVLFAGFGALLVRARIGVPSFRCSCFGSALGGEPAALGIGRNLALIASLAIYLVGNMRAPVPSLEFVDRTLLWIASGQVVVAYLVVAALVGLHQSFGSRYVSLAEFRAARAEVSARALAATQESA